MQKGEITSEGMQWNFWCQSPSCSRSPSKHSNPSSNFNKEKDFQFIAILNILREQELETDESP